MRAGHVPGSHLFQAVVRAVAGLAGGGNGGVGGRNGSQIVQVLADFRVDFGNGGIAVVLQFLGISSQRGAGCQNFFGQILCLLGLVFFDLLDCSVHRGGSDCSVRAANHLCQTFDILIRHGFVSLAVS